MPVLDGIKAQLTTHLQSLVTKMTIGTAGGEASSRDGGIGKQAFTVTPTVQRIDDRSIVISGSFNTEMVSAHDIKEVSVHGSSQIDSPAYRSTFHPISKNSTNEIRVEIIMEVR